MKKALCLITVILLLLASVACNNTPPEENKRAYVFRHGQTDVPVNAEADAILQALGAWVDYSESPSCAFEGMDKVYLYQGFRVQTYSLGGKDYIHSVELTDDSVATAEGITVGALAADVTAAYGTPTSSTDNVMTYVDAQRSMYLQFILRGGTVTNISYVTETKTPG